MSKIRKGEFTFAELKYFLFSRKICKVCGSKMKRKSSEKYVGIEKFSGIITGPSSGETYEVTYFYFCPSCNKNYFFNELVVEKDNFIEGKIIDYKRVKYKILWVSLIMFFFGVMRFGSSLVNIIGTLIIGKLNFNMFSIYLTFIYSLALIAIFGGILLNASGNKIYISRSFITITRGVSGKTYKINKESIIAKEIRVIPYKYIEDYQIFVYLKNGKKIGTGYLNCDKKSFETIDKEFKFKNISDMNISKEELINLKNMELNQDGLAVKTNYFLKTLLVLPIATLVIVIGLMLSGVNYVGDNQRSFGLNGTVINKKVEKDIVNLKYKITVKDSKTSKKYDIYVNKYEYDECYLNNKINIKGEKGRLGILYDVKFINEK